MKFLAIIISLSLAFCPRLCTGEEPNPVPPSIIKKDSSKAAATIQSTNPDDINFFLHTNPNAVDEYDEIIYQDVSSVSNSRYQAGLPLIVLSHGFTQNYTSEFPKYVRDAYLEAGFAPQANIIVVNWGKLSSAKGDAPVPAFGTVLDLPLFLQAVANVKVVGKRLQEFLVFLEENKFLAGSGQDIHLVGQSLGAHVSGMAGYYYRLETNNLINRITGTDPALPGFEISKPDARLDSSDAFFVDIVHTNRGVMGYAKSIGHVDFYVNEGGPIQPSCSSTKIVDYFCSHNLAPRYYAKSILSNSYKACPKDKVPVESELISSLLCKQEQQIVFGEYVSLQARGDYELTMEL